MERCSSTARVSSMVTKPDISFPPFRLLSVGAVVGAWIREEQHLNGRSAARTLLRVADALDERLDERVHLLIELVQLFDRDVEQKLARSGGLLPLGRGVPA